MTAAKTIELVVPVLNETGNLGNFVEAISKVFREALPGYQWKAIFVDDGSTDGSWRMLREMTRSHPNLRAIRLNHNYGSHLAISAGLSYVEADAAVVLAADLQDPPGTIPEFVKQWENGFRVVWGVRAARREALHRKLYSRAFHYLVRKYALRTYPSQGTGSFCLIDRVVVRNLRSMKEDFRTIFGLIAIQGYPAAEVPYARQQRTEGQSGWSFKKMLRTSIDVFTSYSHLPVRTITWVGLASCVLAALAVSFQLYRYFAYADTLRGWTLLFSAVCFFGGIQTLSLGVLGEYMWRTFHEVKHRPLWFVDEATFGSDD